MSIKNQDNSAEITGIKDVTDVLPDDGALTSISAETDKIDGAAADGLSGVAGSLAYEVDEVETHLHSYESVFGVAATPSGETHVADRLVDTTGPFVIDAGNDDWGSWVQVLGSDDTPSRTGMVYYDLNEFDFVAAERDETYYIQIGFGDSGADALANDDLSEKVVKPQSNLVDAGNKNIQCVRQAAGTKAWIRCKCPGQNTATLSLYIGLHEYEG
jgi:hypothetical protein